jgi:hypothetical protein
MHSIEARIHAVRSRQQWQWMWLCVSRGLVAGGVLGCVVAAARGMTDAAFSPLWIVAAALVGPVLGALFAQIHGRSLDGAAVAIDRGANLKDRAQNALRFLAQPGADQPIRRLAIADADSYLATVDPGAVAPLKTPRACLWGATLCAAALIGTLWTGPADDLLGALQINDVVVAQAARLEDGLEELRRFQAEEDQADVDQLIRQLAQQIEELKTPGLDAKEALAHLSEMEVVLQDMQQQLAAHDLEAELREIGEAMTLAESLAAAGQAMSQGDMEKAAEELAKLEMPELDRKTEKAIAEKLDQLQLRASSVAKRQLAEAARKMSEGLTQGDRSRFKEGAEGLASECRRQGRRKKLADLLRKQNQCLGECKSACEGQCKGDGDGRKGAGSNQRGTASGGSEPGDKTPMLKTGPQIDLTGQQSADGDSDVETVQSGEQQEEALRQYRQNLEQYEALRESVLENEAIPLGHRQTIRRYFELIRPKSTDAEP